MNVPRQTLPPLHHGIKNIKNMEVITIESKAFQQLMAKLDRVERFVLDNAKDKSDHDALWLDKDTVCAYLKISKRTLQRYRSNGVIAYSLIGRKTYYSVASVKQLLKEKNIRRDNSSLDELARKGQLQTQ